MATIAKVYGAAILGMWILLGLVSGVAKPRGTFSLICCWFWNV